MAISSVLVDNESFAWKHYTPKRRRIGIFFRWFSLFHRLFWWISFRTGMWCWFKDWLDYSMEPVQDSLIKARILYLIIIDICFGRWWWHCGGTKCRRMALLQSFWAHSYDGGKSISHGPMLFLEWSVVRLCSSILAVEKDSNFLHQSCTSFQFEFINKILI